MNDELNICLQLTREFNAGRPRALLAGGQAVVLYRLAIMSKDGDWVLREDEEALEHVLAVLAMHGARYRYGAPLALPWMRAGWSAHLECAFRVSFRGPARPHGFCHAARATPRGGRVGALGRAGASAARTG